MNSTRREVLMFAGGSAVGLAFTPVPWRLVTDSALWSENWPGVPVPLAGEIRVRYTNCGLCTAGCAVRARCIVDQPIALSGVSGGLCPFGLTAHHLPYLPGRVKEGPVKEATAAVADALAKCRPGECVATLDLRPARTASWTYRRAMAAIPNGRYLTPAYDPAVAVDLSQARTVVSFGVPVLDGWGTPANVNAARSGFQLIQVETVESRTASMADQWIRADSASLTESDLASLVAQVKDNGPVLVLGSSRLASTGRTVVARRETPVPEDWKKAAPVTALASLPDRSVRVLLIDEAAADEYLPWYAIEKKLVADNALVVAFTSSREGYARHAHYVLPAGVYPEVADDIPPAIDSVTATFRIAAPLVAPPAATIKPEEFVAAAAGLSIGDTLHERADAIHQAGRGTLVTYADAKSTPVKDVTAADFWKALNAGGHWIDSPDDKQPVAQFSFDLETPAPAERADLPLAVVLHRELTPGSPILSKLYRESNLRLAPNQVALHPSCGFESGARVTFQTMLGGCPATVLLDAGVPPGVVLVSATPAILDVCPSGTRAKVVSL